MSFSSLRATAITLKSGSWLLFDGAMLLSAWMCVRRTLETILHSFSRALSQKKIIYLEALLLSSQWRRWMRCRWRKVTTNAKVPTIYWQEELNLIWNMIEFYSSTNSYNRVSKLHLIFPLKLCCKFNAVKQNAHCKNY